MCELFYTSFRNFVVRDDPKKASLSQILETGDTAVKIKRVFVKEGFARKELSKVDLINQLDCVIHRNYFTFNKKRYLQVKGIPQGLNVSQILSNFYYASLEKKHLQPSMRQDS